MLLDRMVGELEETTGKHPILSALYKTFSGELMDEIGKIPDLPPNAVPEKHTWLHRIAAFAHTMTADPQQHAAEEQQHLVIRLRGFVDDVLKVWDLIKENDLLRHLVIMLDLAASTVIGMIDDRVITDGFMAIEHYDGNEWLEKHGCHFPNCPITQGMYDAAFAYEGGESKNRRMGAGSLLYGALRLMLTYRGAFMWHMAAGMGETIMSPLYLALRQRGVHLAFFHKVTNLGLSADKKRIETIDIDIQATVKPEYQNGYEPLFPGHDGIPCWPTKPFYDQLVQGNEISKASNPDLESWWNDVPLAGKKTLQWKTDFDLVVLAISRGAFEYICKEPIDAEPKWKLMTDNIKTVKTQGLQLWLHRTSPELGWQGAPPVLSGYTEPFDTWSDMSYLLPRESWASELKVKQLAYFCNCLTEGGATPPFSDSDFPRRERDRVKNFARDFMAEDLSALWPRSSNQCAEFDWGLLVNCTGEKDAFDSQFFRANIDPTERYVLSLPGTAQYRLTSGNSMFENLYLAGDWTFTDINIGCIEAAVISGRMASQAICGVPEHIYASFGRVVPIVTDPALAARA